MGTFSNIGGDYDICFLVTIEFTKVVEWLYVNKLSLYVSKTPYVLFTLNNRPVSFDFDITIDGLYM